MFLWFCAYFGDFPCFTRILIICSKQNNKPNFVDIFLDLRRVESGMQFIRPRRSIGRHNGTREPRSSQRSAENRQVFLEVRKLTILCTCLIICCTSLHSFYHGNLTCDDMCCEFAFFALWLSQMPGEQTSCALRGPRSRPTREPAELPANCLEAELGPQAQRFLVAACQLVVGCCGSLTQKWQTSQYSLTRVIWGMWTARSTGYPQLVQKEVLTTQLHQSTTPLCGELTLGQRLLRQPGTQLQMTGPQCLSKDRYDLMVDRNKDEHIYCNENFCSPCN